LEPPCRQFTQLITEAVAYPSPDAAEAIKLSRRSCAVPLRQATGAAASAPPSSLGELPHPRATGPEAALKSPVTIDSNRRRGHPCRRVAPAIPQPNWHLPEYHTHTSHLPDWSTPFVHHLSSWTPASTPTCTAPLQTWSSGDPLVPEMPQSSSLCCRVALAAIPDPPCRLPAPESSQHRQQAGCCAMGHAPSPVPWVTPSVVPTNRRILCKWAAR
jgi:hypothetical protein